MIHYYRLIWFCNYVDYYLEVFSKIQQKNFFYYKIITSLSKIRNDNFDMRRS
jgi:hypothetical protein